MDSIFSLVEQLESRRLLAASVTVQGRDLIVIGTNEADRIIVSRDSAHAGHLVIDVNGALTTLASSTVSPSPSAEACSSAAAATTPSSAEPATTPSPAAGGMTA